MDEANGMLEQFSEARPTCGIKLLKLPEQQAELTRPLRWTPPEVHLKIC